MENFKAKQKKIPKLKASEENRQVSSCRSTTTILIKKKVGFDITPGSFLNPPKFSQILNCIMPKDPCRCPSPTTNNYLLANQTFQIPFGVVRTIAEKEVLGKDDSSLDIWVDILGAILKGIFLSNIFFPRVGLQNTDLEMNFEEVSCLCFGTRFIILPIFRDSYFVFSKSCYLEACSNVFNLVFLTSTVHSCLSMQ